MGGEKTRADKLLVERGFFETRARAQAAIAAGLVTADGVTVRKSSDSLAPDAAITASAPHPYVSRGGVKLEAGLEAFALSPTGKICLDIGASTGGFTEVLLGRDALKVYAVDVGHGQLHASVAADPRVVSLEGTDARGLTPAEIPDSIGFIVADVSFISLRLVLPPVLPLLADDAALVALVKPQFEAGRAHVAKGIVRDPAIHARVCDDIADFVSGLGFDVLGLIPSPIAGGDGNREFLIGARRR
ncbi:MULTISPECIES: TlyA family RNA methyltransferase [unclassified Chelatococcus]|uniref:TlyA family RNA methyltransferase n=1 Tax=unclassified Chelatococcus TaxID=2638111 RepID=UPI001BCFF104|nr:MULTISPECIES: TlyA family RNA methyltransferase [unclassified Chelatococcus]MBS7698304.1 TlyA family RNA methyltransferase [Chelatococcus sp. YT9]MBX3559161.1 TlyA family RNA methyltransferase [Chelatococcus sp.]